MLCRAVICIVLVVFAYHRDSYLGEDFWGDRLHENFVVIQYSVVYFNHYDQLDYCSIFTKIWDEDIEDFMPDTC